MTAPTPAEVRQRLRGSVTVYVRSDGTDATNDGQTNSAGGAFQTIQSAYNAIKNRFDANGFDVTIRLGVPGTYAGGIFSNFSGAVTVLGDEQAPASYVINEPAGQISVAQCSFPALTFAGVTLDSTVAAGPTSTISVQRGGDVFVRNCRYRRTSNNAAASHNYIDTGGRLTWTGTIAVVGNAGGAVTIGSAISVGPQGIFTTQAGLPATVALTNVDLATGFIACGAGYAGLSAASFSGSATGPRYFVNANGVISTNGGGANFLPGSAAGQSATGGQYL